MKKPQLDNQQDQNYEIVRHSSLKPTPTQGKNMLMSSRPSVTFQLNHNFSNEMLNDNNNMRTQNSTFSRKSGKEFNYRYKEYVQRVKEINQAKETLRKNRDEMSTEVKRRMVQQIKHKT